MWDGVGPTGGTRLASKITEASCKQQTSSCMAHLVEQSSSPHPCTLLQNTFILGTWCFTWILTSACKILQSSVGFLIGIALNLQINKEKNWNVDLISSFDSLIWSLHLLRFFKMSFNNLNDFLHRGFRFIRF